MVPVRQLAPCKLSLSFSVCRIFYLCLSLSFSLCLSEHHPYELRERGPHTSPGIESSAPRVRRMYRGERRKGVKIRTCGIICYVRSRVLEPTAYPSPFKSAYVSENPKAWSSERSFEHVNVVRSFKKEPISPREQTTIFINNISGHISFMLDYP